MEFTPEESGLLYRVAQGLLREREYGELLADVLDTAIDGLGADRGFVVVAGENANGPGEAAPYRAAVARNYKAEALAEAEQEVSSSISRAAAESGHALLLGDALDSPQFGANPSVKRMGLRSILSAPLVASDAAFALIYLENRDIAHRFTERQRLLLEEICRLAAPRLRTAVAMEMARRQVRELESSLGASDGILTTDENMGRLLETLRQVAPTDLPVLIQGETGTGKELLARAVYRHSRRAQGPFVVLNCAAVPAGLVESELFGYMRGAFTGATRDRMGLVATAHRGTLFLDEVGELPAELQPRLLRVLQSGEFTRLGSVQPETVDVRFVAATNRDLAREVDEGRFRSDLFYRLAGVTLKIPPLRDRRHDIHLLADHFLRAAAKRYARPAPKVSAAFTAALDAYSFPGNVRELESEMARLVVTSPPGADLAPAALNDRIREAVGPPLVNPEFAAGERRPAPVGRGGPLDRPLSAPVPAASESAAASGTVAARVSAETAAEAHALPPMSLEEMEKRLIVSVLKHTAGNRTRAAEILGISREGLRTKMQRLGLSAPLE
jgi:transcriptional regulator with GAF, ATPase, and Fis domain